MENFGIPTPMGIEETVWYGIVIAIVVIWIYAILRVAKDISWRTENFFLQLLSILLILFLTPIVGLPIYFLIRPVHQDHTGRVGSQQVTCYGCKQENDASFSYCVFCGETLKIACSNRKCKQPIGIGYEYCSWCGTKVEGEDVS